jgi:hypothetical protein
MRSGVFTKKLKNSLKILANFSLKFLDFKYGNSKCPKVAQKVFTKLSLLTLMLILVADIFGQAEPAN